MADNILTKDRADVDLDIAAKDISGVQFPRNILTDAAGADIDPAPLAARSPATLRWPRWPAWSRTKTHQAPMEILVLSSWASAGTPTCPPLERMATM